MERGGVEMKKFVAVMFCICMMCTLCGCGKVSEYNSDDSYVAEVKQLVDDTVKYTRIWQEYDESFNCHDRETAKEYVAVLDKIEYMCKDLLSLTPSAKFDENDLYVKGSAGQLLAVTSAIKSHIEYSLKTADDVLFQKEKEDMFELYMSSYENLTNASQYLQTFWRNA